MLLQVLNGRFPGFQQTNLSSLPVY